MKMNVPQSVGKMFSKNSARYAPRFTCALAILSLMASAGHAQNQPIRVIAFGAHPDDCELGAGGLAAKYAAHGDKVKFVSLTNGDAGHQSMRGEELAKRRRGEAHEAGRRIGIEYEVLDNHDGKLLPTLGCEHVIREIRQWNADIVIAPQPNDYHPDHRYTGVLVQDASYMVIVPDLVTDTPPLKHNPVFLYYGDRFTRPQPFRADIVVSIDDVFEKRSTCWTRICRRSMSGCHGPKGSSSRCRRIPQNGRNGLLRRCAGRGSFSRNGEMLWKGVMARKRPAFSTPRLLRLRNTDASPAKKKFAKSFRFFLSGDLLLCA